MPVLIVYIRMEKRKKKGEINVYIYKMIFFQNSGLRLRVARVCRSIYMSHTNCIVLRERNNGPHYYVNMAWQIQENPPNGCRIRRDVRKDERMRE